VSLQLGRLCPRASMNSRPPSEKRHCRNVMRMPERKKLSLFATKCPKCGSQNTKADWMTLGNYRKAAVTLADPLLGAVAGRFDRVCMDCRHKFIP